ncbi:MAG: Catabolite control protein A [candidate division BRC1 bacterium ADurb.BinA292]|nr:MAG: Catabolite control protein A [candidate division BRC1 bacterium ADurb.BinA292]
MPKVSRKAVTLSTLARELGLSTATVSYVVNGQVRQQKISPATAERVLRAAAEAGYVPNRLAHGLHIRRSGVVGVIVENFRHGWADRVLEGLQEVLDQYSFTVFSALHRGDSKREQREVQSLLERRADAILTFPLPGSRSLYERIVRHGPPLLFLGDAFEDFPQVSYVAWDASAGVRRAVEHLAGGGRKKIGYLAVRRDSIVHRERHDAFHEALREHDLPVNPAWIGEGKAESQAGLQPLVQRLIRRMFEQSRDRPDALIVASDLMALHALALLRYIGLRVPEDVAVIGMGDSTSGGLPGIELTTISEPCEEIGRVAGELALHLIEDKQARPMVRFVPGDRLVVRRTTAG